MLSTTVSTQSLSNSALRVVMQTVACTVVLVASGCATVQRLNPWHDDEPKVVDAAANEAKASATTALSATAPEGDANATASEADTKAVNATTAQADTTDPSATTTTAPRLDLSVPVSQLAVVPAIKPEPARTAADIDNSASTWSVDVQQAIHRNWLQPVGPQIPADFSCEVLVKLTRSGIVEDAKITRSCGHPSLDASVISAIQASSPFSLPSNMDEFADTLLLSFSPR